MSHRVTVTPDDVTVAADEGRRLVLALEDGGLDILHRCGGNARCATCRVEILEGEAGTPTAAEATKLATVSERKPTTRLSCQVQARGPLTVSIARRLHDNPDLGDAGPRPIEWPVDGPLPPE